MPGQDGQEAETSTNGVANENGVDNLHKGLLDLTDEIEENLSHSRRLADDLPVAMWKLRTFAEERLAEKPKEENEDEEKETEDPDVLQPGVVDRLLDAVLQCSDLNLRSRLERLKEDLPDHLPKATRPRQLEQQIAHLISRLPG
jgi:hypothetical protein